MATLKVNIYNSEGKVVGEQQLDPKVFGVAVKQSVVHEVVVGIQNASRETVGHTKTRGEVRGGGKKPWKQKHTGRARHGSTRSPIWKGGGVVFGPRSGRVWATKVNKKTRVAALRMVLSDKVGDGKLVIVESFDVPDYKTKKVASLLKNLPGEGKKTMIALPAVSEKMWKSAANLPQIEMSRTDSLNIIDLLRYSVMVTTPEGVAALTKALS